MTSTLAPQAAVLDGIGLQWLLDPTTDVVASITTYITSSISRWRSGLSVAGTTVVTPDHHPHNPGDAGPLERGVSRRPIEAPFDQRCRHPT